MYSLFEQQFFVLFEMTLERFYSIGSTELLLLDASCLYRTRLKSRGRMKRNSGRRCCLACGSIIMRLC